MILYEFIDRGRPVVTVWITTELQARQRYLLIEKLDRISQATPEIAKTLIFGAGIRHIFKLKIKGNVQLRPLLCYGPRAPQREVTFLLPATEVGGRLKPNGAATTASLRRTALLDGLATRIEYERPA